MVIVFVDEHTGKKSRAVVEASLPDGTIFARLLNDDGSYERDNTLYMFCKREDSDA